MRRGPVSATRIALRSLDLVVAADEPIPPRRRDTTGFFLSAILHDSLLVISSLNILRQYFAVTVITESLPTQYRTNTEWTWVFITTEYVASRTWPGGSLALLPCPTPESGSVPLLAPVIILIGN